MAMWRAIVLNLLRESFCEAKAIGLARALYVGQNSDGVTRSGTRFSARPIGEGIARRKGTGQRLAPPSKARYGRFAANRSDASSLFASPSQSRSEFLRLRCCHQVWSAANCGAPFPACL
ncbi:MAG: hypothetical protein ACO2PK_05060 [Armatimonadota bacterium]